MSIRRDAAGAEESRRKEATPKEVSSCRYLLGHKLKKLVTVIFFRCWAIKEVYSMAAHIRVAFSFFRKLVF